MFHMKHLTKRNSYISFIPPKEVIVVE